MPGDRYPQAPETVQAVAQFWTRIGVKTKVEVVPWSVYSSRATKNDYAVSVIAWGNGTGEAGYGLLQTLATNDAEARARRQQLGPLQQRVGRQGAGRSDGRVRRRAGAKRCSAMPSSW